MKLISTIAILFLLTALPGQGFAQLGNHLKETLKQANPRMVKVFGAGAGRAEGTATGFAVSKDGLILTRQGVFLDGARVRVLTPDGVEHEASVIRRDRQLQLALLKIGAPTPEFFSLSEEDVGKKGDWVVALSNAFKVADKDEPLSATLGVISLRTKIDARYDERNVAYSGDLILIDQITSNPGAAGGALLSLNGQLVGMVGKIITSSETNTRLNYAVPVSALYKFVNNLGTAKPLASAPKVRIELGIQLFKHGGRSSPAYVDRVRRGSPAHKAKLKPDDLIMAIGGVQVGSVKDFEAQASKMSPGVEVVFMIKRGSKVLRKTLIPVEKK